ncbi:CC142 protein, partial [Nothoprocta ornata]|nr:CC142 protein [Nothoprocta ornata]
AEAPAPGGAAVAAGPVQELARALAHGRCRVGRWRGRGPGSPSPCAPTAQVPPACEEELRRLCLRLLCCSVCAAWDQGFTRALGSALSDKCSAEALQDGATAAAQSRTARLLQQLYPALAFALRRLQ